LANQPSLVLAKFLAGFSDLVDFSTAAVDAEYLQLKVIKIVFICRRLSVLTF